MLRSEQERLKAEVDQHLHDGTTTMAGAEWSVMSTHAAIGGDRTHANPGLRPAAAAVRAHHERVDGRGYPDGLKASEIPISARIVAVCDAYDAMAHDRPYGKGIGRDAALAILRENAGYQWDARIVAIFVGLVTADVIRTSPTTLDHLGRSLDSATSNSHSDDGACGCLAALPESVAERVLSQVG